MKKFRCPKCSTEILLEDNQVDFSCSGCGKQFRIKAPQAQSPAVQQPINTAPRPVPPSQPQAPVRQPANNRPVQQRQMQPQQAQQSAKPAPQPQQNMDAHIVDKKSVIPNSARTQIKKLPYKLIGVAIIIIAILVVIAIIVSNKGNKSEYSVSPDDVTPYVAPDDVNMDTIAKDVSLSDGKFSFQFDGFVVYTNL